MSVESAKFINELNEIFPTINDPVSEGDDHIRLIKSVITGSFINFQIPVQLNESQFNILTFIDKNYDNVNEWREEDLRQPNDINEAINHKNDSLFSRISGNTFENLKYTYGEERPLKPADDYPAEKNLYDLNKRIEELENIYQQPVGSIFMSTQSNNPGDSDQLGYGTWVRTAEGKMIGGVGTLGGFYPNTNNLGINAGEYEHFLTVEELPSHNHSYYSIVSSVNDGSLYEVEPDGDGISTVLNGPTTAFKRTLYNTSKEYWDLSEGSTQPYYEDFLRSLYLTEDQMDKSNNILKANPPTPTGESESHENTPPTFGVYVWRRIA